MLPQYKMVLINGILSFILLLGLVIFKYILKRKINLLYLLILISLLPVVSIFRTGSYESGDLSLHAGRLMSFYNLLINYHLIPRWTPEFNAGYGDPHFLFAYFLPYFIGSVFHLIGLSFITSLKLLLASSYVASGIAMFFWVKDELGKKSGIVAAIFYLFTPYHLVDLHFRVTIAENLSFVFLPIILLAAKKIIENNSKKWFTILSISFGLLILSHQVISIMFLPIILLYSVFVWLRTNNKTFKKITYCFLSIIFGLLVSSFYWIPIFFLAKFTQQGLTPAPISFPNIMELLYSPWRYGFLFQGHMGELSYLIGYTQILIICFSIYLFFNNSLNKKLKKLLVLFLIIFTITFLMILPITKPIWEFTPLIKYSQYSTRLLVLLSLSISVIGGIVVKKINKNWFTIILCFITIIYTMLNWGNRRTISYINDSYIRQEFSVKPNVALEPTSPIWADINQSKLRINPESNIEIVKGNGIIKEISRNPIHHTYIIDAKSKIEVKENTLYFPGWVAENNNKQMLINYKNPNSPGVITFSLSEGIHKIEVKFVNLPIITFSKWLSAISFLALLIFAFAPKKLNFPKL